MSLYEVQKLLFHVNREPKVLNRFLGERKTLIAEYRLTEEEHRALLETDFRSLYEMGVCTHCSWDRSRRRLASAFLITWRFSEEIRHESRWSFCCQPRARDNRPALATACGRIGAHLSCL